MVLLLGLFALDVLNLRGILHEEVAGSVSASETEERKACDNTSGATDSKRLVGKSTRHFRIQRSTYKPT